MKTGSIFRFGLMIAFVIVLADQLNKYWTLHIYHIADKGRVNITPFLDLVLVWNKGISYGLFQQDGLGRFVLIGLSLAISVGLIYWLRGVKYRSVALALGLIIGGAIGNAIDRGIYGAVADFFLLHGFGYEWYVFNIADIAISLGVCLLLVETLRKRA